MNFRNTIKNSPLVLTEGGMVERLRRDTSVRLDQFIVHAGLIYNDEGRRVLERIYRQYIDIGLKYKLPMMALAPTWRANPERIQQSDFYNYKNINKDCVEFLNGIRETYVDYAEQIFIGGMIACRGDAYMPGDALSKEDAARFHRPQVRLLAEAGADFIKAATLPALSEAAGMALAMAECDIPYILSFVIRPDGTILDGTPVHEAIEKIDSETDPAPFFYMINCVHPSVFEKGIGHEAGISRSAIKRISGFQANTSSKSPEELDGLSYLDTTDPGEFADSMTGLHKRFGIKILGGCCGSDNRHIEAIAERICPIS
ncbi:homocysteine S-methyltransferase family protein [Desulfococcaceae bacterium HSG8]|nr:homocysteine S-methyltransferase family protein [Desulfococcaceae bacterium HSG8]